MVEEHINRLIRANFLHEPTTSQLVLISGFGSFITNTEENNILIIKGFAGTGKTSLVSSLVKTLAQLKIQSVLLAPTGRAAKVLSSFANMPAYTIHRKIYRQKTAISGSNNFDLNFNKHKDTLFIVDEASMISNHLNDNAIFGTGRLLDDLFNFVFQGNNCKLILIGDSAQLPPVGFSESPALDAEALQNYHLIINEYLLTDVVRQSAKSGILANATSIRQALASQDEKIIIPKLDVSSFPDIESINGGDLIETLSQCYDKYGLEETMVVCRSNKRASLYNKGIRASILYREEELSAGDLLVVVKNNYHWLDKNDEVEFIANGDIAEVVKVRRYEELHGLRFANVTLRFVEHGFLEVDVKIVLDTLQSEAAALTREQQEKLYTSVMEDYAEQKSKKQQFDKLKQDPFFNALQVKFAYAMTCHKAQGGQWKAVFIDQGMINDDDKNIDYLRWLYTAITRATEKVYLVNFPKEQLTQNEKAG